MFISVPELMDIINDMPNPNSSDCPNEYRVYCIQTKHNPISHPSSTAPLIERDELIFKRKPSQDGYRWEIWL